MQEKTPLPAWPNIPSAAVVATQDRVIKPHYLRSVAHDRLGVGPIDIEGGHSPFLARPAELASVLTRLAADHS